MAATAGSSIKFDFSVRTLKQIVLIVFHFIEWILKYIAWRVRLCSVYKVKFPRFLYPLIGVDSYMNCIHKFSLCCRRHSNESLLPCDYLYNMSTETLSSLQCVMEQRLFQPQAGTKIIYQVWSVIIPKILVFWNMTPRLWPRISRGFERLSFPHRHSQAAQRHSIIT